MTKERSIIGRCVYISDVYFEDGQIRSATSLVAKLHADDTLVEVPGCVNMIEMPNESLKTEMCAVWLCDHCHEKNISLRGSYLPRYCPYCQKPVLNCEERKLWKLNN